MLRNAILEPWLVSDHPVCGAKVASQLFIEAAATPPQEEGNAPTPSRQFLHTRCQPWVSVCQDEPALKGRQNGILSPFQGSRSGELQTQGLRPGLTSNAASRLGNMPYRRPFTADSEIRTRSVSLVRRSAEPLRVSQCRQERHSASAEEYRRLERIQGCAGAPSLRGQSPGTVPAQDFFSTGFVRPSNTAAE